jgi:hypothetical protein
MKRIIRTNCCIRRKGWAVVKDMIPEEFMYRIEMRIYYLLADAQIHRTRKPRRNP